MVGRKDQMVLVRKEGFSVVHGGKYVGSCLFFCKVVRMKAPHADQVQLLRIVALDSHINRLRKNNEQHPLRKELGALVNAIAACSRDQRLGSERAHNAARALRKAENEAETVQLQVADKEAKYNAGVGLTSRDLLTLEEEMATLRAQLEELSTVEFEALEEVEASEENVRALGVQFEELTASMLRVKSELEDVVAQSDAQIAELKKQRDAVATNLDSKLVGLYERAANRGHYAVMALTPDGSTTGGIHLSPVEVALVKNKGEDEVYLSEDYDCIIVPVDFEELEALRETD